MENDRRLTTKEAAEILGIAEMSLHQRRHRSKVTGIIHEPKWIQLRTGNGRGLVYYLESVIKEYLANSTII